ncbi:hypothetical protein PPYR_05116 [Photinus pyralis]|uniref:Uncharacterized protein n=1 Tax=Photinus pyralis TaxID=7054 RepID=A0A5N4B0J8_PHOPY|nr:uncharacterized protein LOC116162943 [Photinus pyralis]XP_031334442.1 uncharacterized protein LOC116164405 [Photinus pyralis]KAB0802930.1 hypothetical protein PPYR_05116 [Photinus pyralis]
MSSQNICCCALLAVLTVSWVEAQLPPRITVPGAILVQPNRPQLRPHRLNQDNIPLAVRIRKPIANALPISIPIREDNEDDQSLDGDDDLGRPNIPPQLATLKQYSEDEPPLKPIQFRPERPIPLPAPRPNLRHLDDEAPVLRQPARQLPVPPPQIQASQQQIRQKVRVVANPRPVQQHHHEEDDGRRNKNRKPPVQILRKYRNDNEDGSITWGFENEDGTFKEETIGADCIIRGKYGYIDPEGTRREYSYETGNKCDPLDEDLSLEDVPQKGPLLKPSKNAYSGQIKI